MLQAGGCEAIHHNVQRFHFLIESVNGYLSGILPYMVQVVYLIGNGV